MNERNISLEVATDLAYVYNDAFDVASGAQRSLADTLRLESLGKLLLGENALVTTLKAESALAEASAAYAFNAVPNFREDVVLPANETTTTPETKTFSENIADLFNPELKLSVDEQMYTMQAFWGELGMSIPLQSLSQEQLESLDQAAEANPGKRIVPTPLNADLLTARQQMAEQARKVFPEQQFTKDGGVTALWTPDTNWSYGRALTDPESIVTPDGSNYAKLVYKTADGTIVGRAEYLESLTASGDAIAGEDGTIWAFPVMDVQVQSPRDRQRADEHFAKVSHVETPESLIAMQLLHQANGTPNSKWEIDFANEAIAKTNKKGGLVLDTNGDPTLLRVASVGWRPGVRRVYVNVWFAYNVYGYFGRRGAVSGL